MTNGTNISNAKEKKATNIAFNRNFFPSFLSYYFSFFAGNSVVKMEKKRFFYR